MPDLEMLWELMIRNLNGNGLVKTAELVEDESKRRVLRAMKGIGDKAVLELLVTLKAIAEQKQKDDDMESALTLLLNNFSAFRR